jgi:hypothetical protein
MIRAAQAGRGSPSGEVSLVLWDSRERVAREIWTALLDGTSVQQVAWLPQTDVAFALVRQRQGPDDRQILLRITGGSERALAIPLIDPSGSTNADLHVSPTRPLALLQQSTMVSHVQPRPDGTSQQVVEPRESFTLIGRSGQLGRKLTLPSEMRLRTFQWDEDGNAVLSVFQLGQDGNGMSDRWFALDSQTAALRPISKEPSPYAPKPPGVDDRPVAMPLRVKLAPTAVREGETSLSVGLLWLETIGKSEKPRALVCGDSTGGQLLPGGEGVLYFSQGAVWVAPLWRLTQEEYQTSITQAQQAVALSNARQVGLALMMYAQDHDEALPVAGELRSGLAPYLKNGDFVEGFVFTYLGGKLNEVQSPRQTELGYVTAPGGRVVVYADGHAGVKKE